MRGALDCVSAKISPTESTEVFTIHSYSAPDLRQKKDVESQSDDACSTRRKYLWMFCVDLPLLALVLTLIGLFEIGVIPGNKGGFYCGDQTIMFPYTGETVTTSMLMSGLLLMPALFFLITEFALSTSTSRCLQALRSGGWLYRSYTYGLLMNLCVVEVMKGIVGGPRPTFMDLCKPNVVCNGTEFVSNFECTSTFSWWEKMDSYRSFPSGHTSMSIYCGFFLAWYLQARAFSWRHLTVLAVPFLQLVVVSLALVSSLTRVTDHRHHWWDVLTGCAVGVVTLLYAVIFLSNNFKTTSTETKEEESRKTTRTLLFDEQS